MARVGTVALQGSSRGLLSPLLLYFVLHITISGIPAQAADGRTDCQSPFARLVSIQGSVEVQRSGGNGWTRVAQLDTPVCPGDRLRTGPQSRAALFIQPETLVRVDQNTSVTVNQSDEETLVEFVQNEIVPVSASAHACGAGYFITRFPRKFKVRTPHLSAAVEGTEFLVAMRCEATDLSVFEGKVLAASAGTNIFPSQSVVSGQTLTVGGGEPPAIKLQLKPKDAVQWTLYYPPITPAGAAPAEDCLAVAQDNRVPCLVARAENFLRAGRVEDAQSNIGDALAIAPYSSDAKALSSVISLVRNDKAEALRLAKEAVDGTPGSAPAWLALSYAQQADFKLEPALASAQRAAEITPSSALALARVAELQLSLSWTREAEKTAKQAVAANPSESRAHMILGFVHLAQINVKDAREDFERAVELDSTEPLSRLGLGLAIIRKGSLVEGREQIEIAVALDPTNSLLRSYVGKAYYEENSRERDQLAGVQFESAKALDPKDPTPWLYEAILFQSQNKPVEALQDLQKSSDLNENRSVYRSRLLLDDDLAVRSANQATLFTALGFDQLALINAYNSLDFDGSDYSGHRFLSDYYATRPRYEVARDSELLQAQLLQPINLNPVKPRLASDSLGFLQDFAAPSLAFNEFTRLYDDRTPIRLTADGLVGERDTFGSSVTLSGVVQQMSYSFGHFHFETDGFRENNRSEEDISNAFIQVELTRDTSLLAEVRHNESESGSTRVFFFDTDSFVNDEIHQESSKATTSRLGFRHRLNSSTTVIGTYAYREFDDNLVFFDLSPQFFSERTQNGELRLLYQGQSVDATAGLGYLSLRQETDPAVVPGTPTITTSNSNAYTYLTLRSIPKTLVNLGVSYDSFKDFEVERTAVNPKFGATLHVTPNAVLRAAALKVQSRPLISSQTLEPTQVAGFNQFFEDVIGAESKLYGLGYDQRIAQNAYAGVEATRRELTKIHRVRVEREASLTEEFFKFYAYVSLTRAMALSGGYERRALVGDDDGFNPLQLANSRTHLYPLELRVFHGNWFGTAKATFINQSGRFCDFSMPPPNPSAFCATAQGKDSFWLADFSLVYRFPNRQGTVGFELRNAFDSHYRFQDTDPNNSPFARGRILLGRINVEF